MKRLLPLLLLPLTVAAQDFTLDIPKLPHPVKVSLPENYDPAVKHPTFFYYHGTSGRPTTDLMRTQAGNKDWIIVGMTYTHRGKFTLSPQSFAAEQKIYHTVRSIMIAKHGTDPDKLYIGGFSLGGWHTDLMLQAEPTISGGIIIGAGHAQIAPGAMKKYPAKKPIHIALGRSDGSYTYALKGFLHHRQLGGTVSLEVWPSLGHAYPENGSDSIRQWLALRAKSPVALAPLALKELTEAVAKTESLKPIEKWDRLREVKDMPYFALTPPAWQAKFKKSLAALEATGPVVTDASLYSKHRRLLHQEITNRTLTSLKKVNLSYLDLSSKYPNTRQGKLLEEDFKRTAAILKQIKVVPREKKPTEIPSGPVPQRRIPGNPLIR
ncbi:MAG: dienelactone hydrolase [Akkermansiaceae bacterium]|jgi:dienelactone hydrolase